MKKILLSMSALLAMVACSKDEVFDAPMVAVDAPVITASFEQSRVSIADNGGTLEMSWAADDELSVFMGTGNMQYSHKGEGEFEPKSGEQGSALSVDANYAVYPYASSGVAIAADGTLSLTMPAEQSYADKSFGAGANTMVAATASKSATEYNFKNVGGYLRLKLYGNNVTVKSIEFKGNNNEPLAGAATVVAATDAAPALTWGATPGKTITLDCGAGVELGTTKAEATEFWFVVPETDFDGGFTVTITDTDGDKMVKSTTKPFETVRNYIKTMEAFQVVPEVGGEVIFDAKFNADGSATNVGSMSELTITRRTNSTGQTPLMSTYANQFYPHNNMVAFTHDISKYSSGQVYNSFYDIDYSSSDTFKNALADGYTVETVIMLEKSTATIAELKAIGATESGGFCISAHNKNNGTHTRYISFTNHAGGYKVAYSTKAIELGKYYHVVGVFDYDAQKAHLYINGELNQSVELCGAMRWPSNVDAQRIVIGADPCADTRKSAQAGWYGDIGMVRFYDNTLSADDIAKCYAALTLP